MDEIQMSKDIGIEMGGSMITQKLGELCGLDAYVSVEVTALFNEILKIYPSSSHTVFKEFLDYAIEQGWIDYGEQAMTVYLTHKGLNEARGRRMT